MRKLLICLIFGLVCAGCGSLAPRESSLMYRKLELALDERFDASGKWLEYETDDGLRMRVERGAYRMRLTRRQFSWTQLPRRYEDVVAEADVALQHGGDAFYAGLACRLDAGNSGRGYYFLISGDGYFTIRWSNGRSLDDIVGARFSDAIKRGDGVNRMRAVCIGDYLALWINDVFVAEARDKRANAGAVGLAAALNRDGAALDTAIDNLKVWRAAV